MIRSLKKSHSLHKTVYARDLVFRSGKPFPLGATWDGEGVNFAIYSKNATAIHLCLFNADEIEIESHIIPVRDMDSHNWHVYVPGLQPGQLYGYRVFGPYDPVNGYRFNPNKLLLDPYTKAISGTIEWHDSVFGYEVGHYNDDLSFSEENNAAYVPKSVVIDHRFDWEDDKPLAIPYNEVVIYEAHVKGFTITNNKIPSKLRGTYAGVAHPVSIDHLKKLGITSIELMPIHHFVSDKFLADKGLNNYWGYNTIGFLAPDVRYSAAGNRGEQVIEFKEMVKALHKAGIEVILDVVYNHTGEGNHLGPTLSYRGVDNMCYYRLTNDQRYCMDYTGTGNTMNAMMPNVLRIIMDSLRYWIIDMHVDGFRFDLAPTLAREHHAVDRLGSFFDIIHQDPVISQVKLIAEPWDVGEGGYQIGNFPPDWAEWNGKYRDCIRDYWRGSNSMLSEFALRFTGSADLYNNASRRPTASINFITAHDGFTLHDLVSYNIKHNWENLEDNQDGDNQNHSWNCGIEGPSDNVDVQLLRMKQKRNLLVSLFLSQGVPMIVAGDELGRTQNGNNNAYCQDNKISWIDWDNIDTELLQFTQHLIHFYKQHPIFSRRSWFKGRPVYGNLVPDIAWFLPAGIQMTTENWKHDYAKSIGVFLHGNGLRMTDETGHAITDSDFYLIFNAHNEPVSFILPPEIYGICWKTVMDSDKGFYTDAKLYSANEHIVVEDRSLVVLESFKRYPG